MKKIMFNDRYGLTEAVLQGRKTVTRRMMNPQPCGCLVPTISGYEDGHFTPFKPPYQVGEIVAVAQSYNDIVKNDVHFKTSLVGYDILGNESACNNKMFVKAELMPRQIRILNIRAERLQDITREDCGREGLWHVWQINKYYFERKERDEGFYFDTLREAYASLIDKIIGKGTWERNPFVWRIEFELVKPNSHDTD